MKQFSFKSLTCSHLHCLHSFQTVLSNMHHLLRLCTAVILFSITVSATVTPNLYRGHDVGEEYKGGARDVKFLSNAQRMARGLPPNAPKRLWTAPRTPHNVARTPGGTCVIRPHPCRLPPFTLSPAASLAPSRSFTAPPTQA